MKKNSIRAKHIDFIFIDLICVLSMFFMSYEFWLSERSRDSLDDEYLTIGIILGLAYLFIVFTKPAHSGTLRRSILREFKAVVILNAELLIILLIYLFVIHSTEVYSRMTLGLFAVFDTILMLLLRSIWKAVIRNRYSKEENKITSWLMVRLPALVSTSFTGDSTTGALSFKPISSIMTLMSSDICSSETK